MGSIRGDRGRRAGLTLIEVLVTIGIIAIVIALLVPAVQYAREASRRAECINNLRQIGIALHSYHAKYDSFPSGQVGRGYSLHTAILPQLEQDSLYNAINFQVTAFADAYNSNMTVATTRVSTYTCPSDPQSPNAQAWTNYAGNRGFDLLDRYTDNGAFSFHDRMGTRVGDFTDGTSSTIAIAEWVIGPRLPTVKDELGTVFDTNDSPSNPDFSVHFPGHCSKLDLRLAQIAFDRKGELWMIGDYVATLYNHVLGVNEHSCMPLTLTQRGAYSAGSRHPGGANALFADGHVSFERIGIALPIWRALGTRNGGENTSD